MLCVTLTALFTKNECVSVFESQGGLMRDMLLHEELRSGIQATRLQRRPAEAAAGLGTTVANLLTVRDKNILHQRCRSAWASIAAMSLAVWPGFSALWLQQSTLAGAREGLRKQPCTSPSTLCPPAAKSRPGGMLHAFRRDGSSQPFSRSH